MTRLIIIILLLLGVFPGLLASRAVAAPSCAELAEEAGAKLGIPQGLMSAISLVETGTGGRAWPWTLNEGGKGSHFDTKDEAVAHLRAVLDTGVSNVDVGCMQLNVRWHGKGFQSPEAMLDPVQNTTYAALFLLELYKRLGTWEAATANYHSADSDRGAAYQKKVAQAAGAPMPEGDLTGETELAEAPQDGVVRGILLASAQPLVTIIGANANAAIVESAAKAAGDSLKFDSQPVVLRTRETISPRLGRRWNAVLAARAQLGIGNESIP